MKTNNKTDLVEIKKDKTGHGLLIEHDGYEDGDGDEFDIRLLDIENDD